MKFEGIEWDSLDYAKIFNDRSITKMTLILNKEKKIRIVYLFNDILQSNATNYAGDNRPRCFIISIPTFSSNQHPLTKVRIILHSPV